MKYLSTSFIARTTLINSSLTEEVTTSLREAMARVWARREKMKKIRKKKKRN